MSSYNSLQSNIEIQLKIMFETGLLKLYHARYSGQEGGRLNHFYLLC